MPLFYRLGGVYGPGEESLSLRTARVLKSPFMAFCLCWDTDLETDFVHIRNAVQAHLLVHFYMQYTHIICLYCDFIFCLIIAYLIYRSTCHNRLFLPFNLGNVKIVGPRGT